MWSRRVALCLLAGAPVLAGCGGGEEGASSYRFPAAGGRALSEVLSGANERSPVLSPAVSVLRPGRDRYGFGLFTVGRENLTDVDSVALYVARGVDAPASGPFPVRRESLETDPRFTSTTTSKDPDSAKVVYVARVKLPRKGSYAVGALIRRGDETEATGPAPAVVKDFSSVPSPGEAAPRVSTPTRQSAGGDLAKIDTRDPHDSMHEADLADVLGKKPVVLVFATPALCQSRTCGPVVDVAEQVKARYGRRVAFIHMEIYNQNDPNKGFRRQLGVYGLPTEPWAFLIDARGRVREALEGAFSVRELSSGVARLLRG